MNKDKKFLNQLLIHMIEKYLKRLMLMAKWGIYQEYKVGLTFEI